jgi:hypothetical protein
MKSTLILTALLSLFSIVSYAQIKPITGLTLEQKRSLAKYKLGFQYQELDIISYREQLENCRKINLSLTEIERLKNEQVLQLKEVIQLKDIQISTLQSRLEVRLKTRANWFLIVLSFLTGLLGALLIL